MRRVIFLATGLFVAAGTLAALTWSAAVPAGQQRTIYMSAVEYKGGTNVATEPYPPSREPGTRLLSPTGDAFGYRLEPPDATGRWEVESYRWEPGFLVVQRGDRVRLEIVGINGAMHDAQLFTPSGAIRESAVVTRGRLTIVRFRADESGLWRLVCNTHPPAMTAEILVP